MLLREAAGLCRSARLSATRRFALLCSFEPLHLKTYLQARCAARFPEETPEAESFGYDQLHEGLERTSAELKNAPAALILSWEDVHPALTWRARGRLGGVSGPEVLELGRRLGARVEAWIRARPGVSILVVPPPSWLPAADPTPSFGAGEVSAAARAAVWGVAAAAAAAGARVLELESELNYRDLLIAGHPLPLERCDALARDLVETAYPSAERRKGLVVDLDGTLWHGVIGEGGPQGVKCRDEGAGRPFFVFQKLLAKLKGEGVLLAFCSKNNPDDVLPHFDGLEMPLKLSDFSSYRCNWDSKTENLRALAADFNLGTDALVFVDDNEAELAEVRSRLPGTEALAVPREGKDWLAFFARLQDLFGAWRVGAEDRLRSESVAARRAPPAPPAGTSGLEHLRELALKLTISRDAFSDPRALELVNKTNQFNLTGERLSQDQWLAWAAEPGAFCWSVKLADRFGDFGTICVVAGRLEGGEASVRQFVLSCRAFGRGVEILVLGELARSCGGAVRGPFRDTGKNEPARRFLAGFGRNPAAGDGWRVEREAAVSAAARAAEESGAVVAVPGGAER